MTKRNLHHECAVVKVVYLDLNINISNINTTTTATTTIIIIIIIISDLGFAPIHLEAHKQESKYYFIDCEIKAESSGESCPESPIRSWAASGIGCRSLESHTKALFPVTAPVVQHIGLIFSYINSEEGSESCNTSKSSLRVVIQNNI